MCYRSKSISTSFGHGLPRCCATAHRRSHRHRGAVTHRIEWCFPFRQSSTGRYGHEADRRFARAENQARCKSRETHHQSPRPERETYKPQRRVAGGIARQEGLTGSYMTRAVRLSFLNPEITRAILDGCHPSDLTAAKLTRFQGYRSTGISRRPCLALPDRTQVVVTQGSRPSQCG